MRATACYVGTEGFMRVTACFGNEIVKEQMVQTTSKKIVRSSEKQKPRAFHIHPTSGLKVLCRLRLA